MSDDAPEEPEDSHAATLASFIVAGSLRMAAERMQQILVCLRAEGVSLDENKLAATALFALAMSSLYRGKPTLTEEQATALFTSLWEMRAAQRSIWYESLAHSGKPKGSA